MLTRESTFSNHPVQNFYTVSISFNNGSWIFHRFDFLCSGPNCTDCVKGWYSVNCSVNCVEVSGQYTCNSTTGDKVCETNWTGPQCDSCATNYYGSKCSTFCTAGVAWTCDSNGNKTCTGKRTGMQPLFLHLWDYFDEPVPIWFFASDPSPCVTITSNLLNSIALKIIP